MPVSLHDFLQAAYSAWFGSSDILVGKKGKDSVTLGNLIFSSGSEANKVAMAAFRDALSSKLGVFGEHAFDTILGQRMQTCKSLRACDVKAVLSGIEALKKNRYIGELNRQMDIDPKMLELPQALQNKIRRHIASSPLTASLKSCRTPESISCLVSERITAAIDLVCSSDIKEDSRSAYMDGGDNRLQNKKVDALISGEEPTGLRDLKITFDRDSTSIEDKIRNGSLGTGMRINRSQAHPVLLVGLKTNGVEPGFICKKDWSTTDTRSMMTDMESKDSLAALDKLRQKHPDIAKKCAGLPLRDQIMLFGRAHPAGMSAVAEYVLEKGMENQKSAIYRAFADKFPGTPPEQWNTVEINHLKKTLFREIRDAVLGMDPLDESYKKSPVFKHFQDRHIVKLDYNEGSRIFMRNAASKGMFMRPERTAAGKKAGTLYRIATSTTANRTSAGAVTEALANDLTRLAGVPAQELSIVRGQYSDGHPKLMLEAKFAEDYKDMGNGYLRDGRVVPPPGKNVESLGKYKAVFLVLADRDAVGRLGQNKGFSRGKFFAIDPGHSLEGNGRDLQIEDNLSFKDTHGFALTSRFANYSVFDDDTRFAKFQGILKLRELKNSGKIEKLFRDYRTAFNPDAPDITAQEKELRRTIMEEIGKKEEEFSENLGKVLDAVQVHLALYDALSPERPEIQEKAIETIENLEKLTSPTTWMSRNGEVPLKHLEVIPETRNPWHGQKVGDHIIYMSTNPVTGKERSRLEEHARASGAFLSFSPSGEARLVVQLSKAAQEMDAFAESSVARTTHPEEAAERGSRTQQA